MDGPDLGIEFGSPLVKEDEMVLTAMAWTPEEWAEAQLGRTDLGDRRRTHRAVKLAAQMMRRPGASVPTQAGRWADTKASYRLFNEAEVTFETLGREHWQATRQAAAGRSVVLMIEDTTELDYTAHPATVELGPIGDGGGWGFLLHSTLAVDPHGPGEVLGLAYQLLFCRQGRQPEQTRTQRQRRDRESQIWGQSVAAVGASGSLRRWVHVCDRYADNFEMFDACRRTEVDLLIRLAQDRRCAPGHQANEPSEHLMQWARALPASGEKTLLLRRRPKRAAREARLHIAYSAATIFPPWLSEGRSAPWRGWVVRVWEPQAPPEEEPIEWVLLTSVPVLGLEDALSISHWYSLRWLVEEYHKALKTGCQVEARQMETRARLEACIGMLAVVAVRLLQLKLWARRQPERPAAEGASAMHVQVLAAYWKKPLEAMTAGEFWRDVARLGGFLARKSDGEPGWQTLWRGWQQLEAMTLGATLFQQGVRNCG